MAQEWIEKIQACLQQLDMELMGNQNVINANRYTSITLKGVSLIAMLHGSLNVSIFEMGTIFKPNSASTS